MRFIKNNKTVVASIAIIALLLAAPAFITSCSNAKKNAGENSGSASSAAGAAEYIVMEKVISDAPGRNRTTQKILIPKVAAAEVETATLQKALDDLRKNDPSLKAVIIWAYRSRKELNASNFTVGKLEWSADGKDFNGQVALSPNPAITVNSN